MRLIQSLANLFRSKRLDRDLDDELAHHIDMRAREYVAGGMTESAARARAMRGFGNQLGIREDTRRMWGISWLESIVQDLRYSARMLRKRALLTLVALVSLAFGIGVSGTMWNVYNSTTNDLPAIYHDPDHLLSLWETPAHEPGALQPVSAPFYDQVRGRDDLFEQIGVAVRRSRLNVRLDAYPISVNVKAASPGLFSILGVAPVLGRNFQDREAEPVVILAARFVRDHFDSAEDALGQTIEIDGVERTIIGVMPERFWFLDYLTDLWLPLDPANPGQSVQTLVRLREGVTAEQAEAALGPVLQRVAAESGREDEPLVRVVGYARARRYAESAAPGVVMLLIATVIGLLITCINVGIVMAGRSVDRERETAVRTVLGARRSRVFRVLMIESLLLAAVGAMLALPVSWASLRLLLASMPQLRLYYDFPFDAGVLGYFAAVAAAAGLVACLTPAVAGTRSDPGRTLQRGGRTIAAGRQALRSGLVVAEIVCAVTVVVTAGALWRNYQEMVDSNPGFSTTNLTAAFLHLPENSYAKPETAARFAEQAVSSIDSIAGVQSAAAMAGHYLMDSQNEHPFRIAGREDAGLHAAANPVTDSFFSTMRIPQFEGRAMTASDDALAAPAVWINQAMATRFWGERNPVGEQVFIADDPTPRTIAGVVGNIRNRGPTAEQTAPAMYVPYAQYPTSLSATLLAPMLVVRTTGEVPEPTDAIRAAIAGIDPNQAVIQISTVESSLRQQAGQILIGFYMLTPIIAVSLFLCALGVYGILAFSVGCRRHEIGVRMALGAGPRAVMRMVLKQGLFMAGIGVVVGVAVAVAGVRLLSGFLFPLSSANWIVFAGAGLLLLLVAMVASWIPTRRAARVNPMTALRCE